MIILDGKKTSKKYLDEIKATVASLQTRIGRSPRLDMILVGDDYASEKYIGMKERTAGKVGFEGIVHRLPETSTTEDVIELIEELNVYKAVDGFMVQLPMPEQIDENRVLSQIDPAKDVDGLTSHNLGKLLDNDDSAYVSATPMGIKLLLDEYKVDYKQKRVVILGRSKEVGLPLFGIFNNADCTVTVAHSKTKDIEKLCKSADILVSSVGIPKFVKIEHVKEGAVVIDVGINMDPNSHILIGDVDYLNVAPICSYITPVPGGVGPMTISALMWNTLQSWKTLEVKS